jgi:hypothetical protein
LNSIYNTLLNRLNRAISSYRWNNWSTSISELGSSAGFGILSCARPRHRSKLPSTHLRNLQHSSRHNGDTSPKNNKTISPVHYPTEWLALNINNSPTPFLPNTAVSAIAIAISTFEVMVASSRSNRNDSRRLANARHILSAPERAHHRPHG